MTEGLVTIFGGSGFLGRHLVRRLATDGLRVRVAVRDLEGAGFLKPLGDVGQIVAVRSDLRDEAAVARAVDGAAAVVNLVGILFERGGRTFQAVHVEGAGRIAARATAAGAGRLVHVSAIGAAADGKSRYARSKGAGEAAVRAAYPGATILRPSIVFGPEDDFFNRFGALARIAPALPLIGGGTTRFQPVYVGDVADAIRAGLGDPATAGKTYELGGPRIYSFRELMAYVLAETRRRRPLIPLPFGLASLPAMVLECLPVPPLTRDQVKLLRRDNVVSPGAASLVDLGIRPTPLEAVVPGYLARYRRGGLGGASRLA
ncbi:MAG: complex I NDUFA9 subunit family protein [Alphaproteobacteria bacterium]|nr:complex I NDUFA9 subunit family protein [Alphaproteobacteria bacterium]